MKWSCTNFVSALLMLPIIFISQIGLVARHVFSYMYSVLGIRQCKYHQDTAPDLEGLLGRSAEVWNWYRTLGRRYYVLCLINRKGCLMMLGGTFLGLSFTLLLSVSVDIVQQPCF